jgi:WD40 repeat protein
MNDEAMLPARIPRFIPPNDKPFDLQPFRKQLSHRLKKKNNPIPIRKLFFGDRYFAVGTFTEQGGIRVFDYHTGQPLYFLKNETIFKPSAALLGKHHALIWPPDSFACEIRELDTGKCVKRIPFKRSLLAHAYDPSGRLFTASKTNHLQVFDVATGELIREKKLDCHRMPISVIECSPAGKYLLTLGVDDTEIYLWDAATLDLLETIRDCGTKAVYRCAFNPSASHVFVRGIENRIACIHLASGKMEKSLDCEEDYPNKFSFTDDGARLVSYYTDGGMVRIWDIEKGTSRKFMTKHVKRPRFFSVHRGKTMIVGDETRLDRLTYIDMEKDTLLGCFYHGKDTFLWVTPPRGRICPALFYTDAPEKWIDVFEKKGEKSALLRLSPADPGWEAHVMERLDRQTVMKRMNNDLEASLRDWVSIEEGVASTANTLIARLLAPCLPETKQVTKETNT